MGNALLNFALIGCGRIGTRHAEHIKQKGILSAVCDISETAADTIAAQYGCRSYYSIEDLLKNEKELQVISVCTPNGLHASHSIQSLNTGHHVLCEKPMALHVKDCEEMISAAMAVKKKLIIVKQNRFNPPVIAVKELLENGKLGKIYSIQLNCFWNRDDAYYNNSWKGTLELDGGTLYTQFSHFIDLLHWMIGDIKNVYAVVTNAAHKNIIEFEDTGVVMMEFQDKIIGSINYTVNSHKRNMEGSLTIFAEKGTVKIGGEYLDKLEYQDIDGYTIENLPAGNPPNKYSGYTGSMSNHNKVYDNLVEVLLNNASESASSIDGLKTVEIIEKIYRAAIRL